MRVTRPTVITLAAASFACATAYACATAAPNVISPLGAYLTPAAHTGPVVPLRADPNAKVILSSAAGLPPASFLPSQATRGAELYSRRCGACHANGQLVGAGFVQSWNDRRVYDLYALVRATMPLSNPGGLTDGEYLDVVAYLLQANKQASPRPDSLRADTASMRATRIAISAQ
jgi:mono/diheme cytochrome c family protein